MDRHVAFGSSWVAEVMVRLLAMTMVVTSSHTGDGEWTAASPNLCETCYRPRSLRNILHITGIYSKTKINENNTAEATLSGWMR